MNTGTVNPLEILKERLQTVLNKSTESINFKSALEDATYSCTLDSVTALEQWIAIWTETDSHCLTEDEIIYQEGVAFVEEQWHKITGMF
jgi:hypothetical protein